MDVGELLSFKVHLNNNFNSLKILNNLTITFNLQPEATHKRRQTEEAPEELASEHAQGNKDRQLEKTKHMRRIAEAKETAEFMRPEVPQQLSGPSAAPLTGVAASLLDPELTEEERINILKYVENEEAEGETLDEPGLKKLMLLFEKKNLKNQELRIKYPDNPVKFMDSEVELHSVIQELKGIATVPDLYPLLVELQGIPSILELLAHPNTDISVAIVDLLQEITDVDILGK